uniref:Nucleoporin NSP1-like C-terminal domain-containing protein n=1 Tax=Cacopsylla melanoneura TaxID=428564 RepID=A0A8D8SW75_9HEMI
MSSNNTSAAEEMTSQDLEARLNQWRTNIDAIKRSYFAEAVHIGDVDAQLDQAQHKLYNWITNVKLMQEKQKLLSQELDFINESQKELEDEVDKINVPEETKSDTSIATSVDELSEKLTSLNMEMSKRSSDTVSEPKIVIAKILNAQLSSLEILSQRINQMRQDIQIKDCFDYDVIDELGSVYDG